VTTTPDADLACLYRETRERLCALVLGLDGAHLATPVPACPGWSVSDVMYHLLGVVEDVMAGRLTRPPTDADTAVQVARLRGTPLPAVVDAWGELAPAFEERIGGGAIWPAVFDVASHEQDIRGALGAPGARDSPALRAAAERLVALMRPSVAVRVVCEDFEVTVGPESGAGEELVLRTTRFEAFRWRLGRRSRAQLRGLDWSGDPSTVIEQLCVMGPSPTDIVE
jgi:uncharacterized protein (TIGR03083 family)